MKRRFNVAGPCRPDMHDMIPAAERLPEAPELIEQLGYFVVHAPRQTGKTTTLRALAERAAGVLRGRRGGRTSGNAVGPERSGEGSDAIGAGVGSFGASRGTRRGPRDPHRGRGRTRAAPA